MSSIISDIFYNSTNNALIDNYLLNRNANDSDISYKNDSHSNILQNKESELKIIKKKNNRPERANNFYEQIVKLLTLKFKISIHPQKQDKNNRFNGNFKSNAIYLLKLKIGLNFIEQHIQSKSNILSSSQLQLQLPLQQIYSHPAISIQLYQSNKSIKPIGSCYMPLENVRGMISKKQEKSHFNLIMKQSNKNKYQENIKYKVQCQLKVENDIEEVSNQLSQRLKYKQKWRNMAEQDSIKFTQRSAKQSSSNAKSRGHSRKISSRQNLFTVTQNPRHLGTGTNKISLKFDSHDERFDMNQKEKQKYAMTSFSRSQSNMTGNQTDNMILKFQLDNKPTRFKIKQFRNKSEQREKLNYKFCIKQKSNNQKNIEFYSINQQIMIGSPQVDKNGINIAVFSFSQTQSDSTFQDCIGYFHLNIVLLLSGIVEGIFPVLSHHNNQCIGFIKLQSLQLGKIKNNINNQIETYGRQKVEQSGKQEKTQSIMIQGYVIEIPRIYSTGQEIDKYLEQGLENKSGQIIIRLSDSSLKVCKQCQLSILYPNIKSEKQNQCHILSISVKEPIVITYQDHIFNIRQSLQIEVYVDYQLIAYHKAVIQLNRISNQNSIIFGTIIQNFTTGSCISNAVINYARFSLFPDYFPKFRFQDSVKIFLNWSINSFLLQSLSKIDYNQIEKQLTQKILSLDSKIIYIQAIRLATLLVKSVTSSNFYYTLLHLRSQQLSATQCTNKQKFIEQIKYLDFNLNGFVHFQDFQSILNYYKVDKKICQGWIRRYCGNNLQFQDQTDEVLYLGLLVDHRCETISYKTDIQNCMRLSQKNAMLQNIQEVKQKQLKIKQKLTLSEEMRASLDNYLQRTEQIVHIQAISCEKMHTLMLNDSIPSLRIKFLSHQPEYISRPVYSCANPIIKLNKKINWNETIIFLHYNLKMGKDIEIGRIMLKKGQKLYELGKQARVQLLEIQ